MPEATIDEEIKNYIVNFLRGNGIVSLKDLVEYTTSHFGRRIEYKKFPVKAVIWEMFYTEEAKLDSNYFVTLSEVTDARSND